MARKKKLTEKRLDTLLKLQSEFGLGRTEIVQEDGTIKLYGNLGKHIHEAVFNPRKVIKYPKYTTGIISFQIENRNDTYALVRNIGGRVQRLLLTRDEVKFLENKEVSSETVKEVVNLVQIQKARFGI